MRNHISFRGTVVCTTLIHIVATVVSNPRRPEFSALKQLVYRCTPLHWLFGKTYSCKETWHIFVRHIHVRRLPVIHAIYSCFCVQQLMCLLWHTESICQNLHHLQKNYTEGKTLSRESWLYSWIATAITELGMSSCFNSKEILLFIFIRFIFPFISLVVFQDCYSGLKKKKKMSFPWQINAKSLSITFTKKLLTNLTTTRLCTIK